MVQAPAEPYNQSYSLKSLNGCYLSDPTTSKMPPFGKYEHRLPGWLTDPISYDFILAMNLSPLANTKASETENPKPRGSGGLN